MLVELAWTLVVVATGGVTVTVTAAEVDALNAVTPPYAATTLLLPTVSLLPATLSDAVAELPEAVRVAVPSETFPAVNVTDPVGAADPLAGFTVAVS